MVCFVIFGSFFHWPFNHHLITKVNSLDSDQTRNFIRKDIVKKVIMTKKKGREKITQHAELIHLCMHADINTNFATW